MRDPSVYHVRSGSEYSNRGGENYRVSNLYIPDNYNGETTHNDMGILKLTRSMTLDGRIRKATKLPSSSSLHVPVDTNCYVQGWGFNPNDPGTNQLYRADVSTVDTHECNKQWGQPVYEQHQVCALGSDDADACSVSF